MKKLLKQTMIGTMTVFLTACGGGGTTSADAGSQINGDNTTNGEDDTNTNGGMSTGNQPHSRGKKVHLKKVTRVYPLAETSDIIEYIFNDDNFVKEAKSTYITNGSISRKYDTKYSYGKNNFLDTAESKRYDGQNVLVSVSKSKFNYKDDLMISSIVDYNNTQDPSKSTITETNSTKFDGPIAIEWQSITKSKSGFLKSRMDKNATAVENKEVNSTLVYNDHANGTSLITFSHMKYDDLNRIVENQYNSTLTDRKQSGSYTETYHENKELVSPEHRQSCFGAELERNYKLYKKYPKFLDSCYLTTSSSRITIIDGEAHHIDLSYTHTIVDGLVTERKGIENNEIFIINTYEYEEF